MRKCKRKQPIYPSVGGSLGGGRGRLALITCLTALCADGCVSSVGAGRLAESPGLPGGPLSEQISVCRINILDEDGNLAVVIAASPHLPGVIRDGQERGSRDGVPGLIFHNNDGDEIGGLIFPTSAREDGRRDGGVSVSFDQVDHGQAVNLIHWTNGDFVRSALKISDCPTNISSMQITDSQAARKTRSALRAATIDEEAERLFNEYLRVMGEERFFAERVYLGSEGVSEERRCSS